MSSKKLPESTFTLEEYEEAVDGGEATFEDLCDKSVASDFYFKVWDQEDGDIDEENGNEVCVAVTPRVFYDENEYLDEFSPHIEHLLPVGVENPDESVFFATGKRLEDVKQEMLDEGFIENEDIEVDD